METLLMKYYKDELCPVCLKKFEEHDYIVVCPDCGTPYHKNCYDKVGHCIHQVDHGSYFYSNDKIDAINKLHETNNINKKYKINEIDQINELNQDNTIECLYCGTLNDKDDEVCKNCKKPLKSNISFFFVNREKFDMNSKIYDIKIKDWFYFLGPSALFYIVKFRFMEKNKRYSLLEFNFGAFIFKELYFLYRKMYLEGVLFLLLRLLLMSIILCAFLPQSIILNLSQVSFMDLDISNNQAFNDLVNFFNQNPQVFKFLSFSEGVLSLFMGISASKIYKNNCIKKIKSIDQTLFKNEIEYRNVLTKKGSVNYIIVFIISFLFIVLFKNLIIWIF